MIFHNFIFQFHSFRVTLYTVPLDMVRGLIRLFCDILWSSPSPKLNPFVSFWAKVDSFIPAIAPSLLGFLFQKILCLLSPLQAGESVFTSASISYKSGSTFVPINFTIKVCFNVIIEGGCWCAKTVFFFFFFFFSSLFPIELYHTWHHFLMISGVTKY